ncbi:MAG TPA: endolytic transglycosylase MltG [Polyangiales bacterium]|nr:endolytic transglycosylase MltG [Polyangiales bacterium]
MAGRDERPRRRIWLALLVPPFVLALAAALAVGYLVVVYPAQRGTGTGNAAISIDPGTRIEQVAEALGRAGALPNPWTFTQYARVMGAGEKLKQGRILVMRNMTARELLQRVASGYGSAAVRVTIPEGWTRFEIADRLAEWGLCSPASFLEATQAPDLLAQIDPRAQSAEGYLFPDTYWLRDAMTPRAMAERMLENGRKRWAALEQSDSAGMTALRESLGFGHFEIVTLASIVEKEAHVPSERAVIAGVFLNRLRDPAFRPKRLQADPTVAYGCLLFRDLPSCASFDGKRVTRTMTADPDNTYNTYRLDGLPPGPIASPGFSAMQAVLQPATHGFFYFVARGDGHHAFTATLESHTQAVQRARSPSANP